MYACGLRAYQGNPAQAPLVLPETLCELRRRIDEALLDALIAMQAAAALAEGLVSPAPRVIDTFPSEQGRQRGPDATTREKAQKKRALIAHIAQPSNRRATPLHHQVPGLKHALTTVMRGFGRRGRGQGRVCVTVVRQTERQLLALGEARQTFGLKAQERLEHAIILCAAQRQRLTLARTTAMRHQDYSRQHSTRLPHGQKRSHCILVKAYDLTLAPRIKGKRYCPAPFGRKPGIASDPASGFIFAPLVPPGNPRAPRYGVPFLDKVQRAIEDIRIGPTPQGHSGAGALGLRPWALQRS
jgi:hypothetical protein